MKKIHIVFMLVVVTAIGLLAWRSCVAVDETEFILLTEFGREVAVYGDDAGESGLHFKWPWQSALAIDRRLQIVQPPPREAITGDKRSLEVSCYLVWRVADPSRFVRSSGTLSAAAVRLDERVTSALLTVIGRHPLESLASTDLATWQLDKLTSEVLAGVAPEARSDLGVDLVDVRLRQFNHPLEVRPAVFDLIRSERKRVAATLRAEGDAEHQKLISRADRERDAILAKADAEAERIKGLGEAEATRILNEAHARDPIFAEFLRTLETYRSILDEQTTVVLSAGSPLLRLLSQGPTENLMKPKPMPGTLSESPPGARSDRVAGAPESKP